MGVCCVYMTDPRLSVSVTLFSPNTGLPPRTQPARRQSAIICLPV